MTKISYVILFINIIVLARNNKLHQKIVREQQILHTESYVEKHFTLRICKTEQQMISERVGL